MEASLVVCLLAAVLATGTCLQCEVCSGVGNSCMGSTQTCAAGQDSCAFVLSDVILVPPAATEPNGRSCRGCYALNAGHCNEQTIVCTGAETQCIDAAGTVTIGGSQMQTVMKGCASESVCTDIKVGSSTFAGISADLTTAKCTAASGAAGVTPGPAGLLLPALAGLLLLKLLS